MTADSVDLELSGCTTEPLMAYLKALGILRLVGEQKDPHARGWWKNDVFWLRAPLLFKGMATEQAKRDALVKYFLEEYRPTPIVVPWSGGDFFNVNWDVRETKYSKTPSASRVIEAVLSTRTDRLAPYRTALRRCKAVLEQCGIDTKQKMEKAKWRFIETLRAVCEEAGVIDWIDAATVITIEKFAPLLGSGGGSDGNTHFSDNFMQNLWDVLPDFDGQKEHKTRSATTAISDVSVRQLRESLFATPCQDLIAKRTSSLYDPGAVGGPNATQGMERDALSNPWDVILTLEGVVGFAGAATKRLAASAVQGAAFPFQVSVSATTEDRLSVKEQAGAEIWLPFWSRPARRDEVIALLREGRAECGSSQARTGVDMARAIASLGVDRGIQTFARFAIVKGRVGGDNYNTAAKLGRFDVVARAGSELLREADSWLDDFRRKCAPGRDQEKAPKRILSALTGIESAIIRFCKYGGARLFQEIVIAYGRGERELALSKGNFKGKTVNPVHTLSSGWMDAADDGSPEFAIARAVASIYDPEAKIGPLRSNLEPVDWKRDCRVWAEKDHAVVWNAADLATNLANVLQRRVMDGQRAGCGGLPLASNSAAPLDAIASFLERALDEQRIKDLLWGLMLIKQRSGPDFRQPGDRRKTADCPLPRTYALLKLLFLPGPIVADRSTGAFCWRLARDGEVGITIRPEPRIMPLLRAGRLGEACRIAAQRLRVSGLPPRPGSLPDGKVRDDIWFELASEPLRAQRLAGSFLIPIDSASVDRLVHLVCRDELALAAT